MTKNEYLRKAQEAYDNERISAEAYDTMIDNADVDAPMFNIAGQRVSNNAKGLVIKNGKKYMLK